MLSTKKSIEDSIKRQQDLSPILKQTHEIARINSISLAQSLNKIVNSPYFPQPHQSTQFLGEAITDHVTLFQHGHPEIIRRARQVSHSNILITTVTLQEQLQGRLAVINKVGMRPERFVNAYANLRATLVFFCNINLLDFNDEAYNCY